MPRSRCARWSLNLALAGVCWLVIFFGLVISGQKGGDTFFANPWLAGTITAAIASSVTAAGFGLYSIVRDHERSVAVFVTTTFGLLVLGYAIAEVVWPH